MKKIFLGLIIFSLALGFSAGIVNAAVGDVCCGGTCGSGFYCSGDDPAGCLTNISKSGKCAEGTECSVGSVIWACGKGLTCGDKVSECKDAGGNVVGGGSVVSVSGPSSCVKVNSIVKMKLKKENGSLSDEITFDPGSWVAPSAVKADQCPSLNKDFTSRCSDTLSWGSGSNCYADEAGIIIMLSTIGNITNWLFYLLMIAVTFMIIYGGFVLLTAQGAPDKVGKGRGIITFAIIGLAVALLAKIIPSVVRFIMGV